MEEQPSFASSVESLNIEHPFRVIFEQVKKNLAYVGFSLDGDNHWITVFDIPHKRKIHQWFLQIVQGTELEEWNPYISVAFEQEAVQYKVEYILTFLPDHFHLEYFLQEGFELEPQCEFRDGGYYLETLRGFNWRDFAGQTTWYKNGVPIDSIGWFESVEEGSYEWDECIKDEQEVLWALHEVIQKQESYFKIAKRTE